jgi:ribosomal protein S10
MLAVLPARGVDAGGCQRAGPLRLPPLRQRLAVLVAPRVRGALTQEEGRTVTRMVEAVKKDWALFALLGLWLLTCLAWRW